jgi:hypothetical protein
VESCAIAEKLERGAGRLEYVVLPHSYRHLTLLMRPRSTCKRLRKRRREGTTSLSARPPEGRPGPGNPGSSPACARSRADAPN